MRKKFVLIILALALFQVSSCAGFDHYYVSTDGNDSNPGTKEKPFQSIQQAVDLAQALLRVFMAREYGFVVIVVSDIETKNSPLLSAGLAVAGVVLALFGR